jgi:two-component system nitrogen regulation response regulator GlnG
MPPLSVLVVDDEGGIRKVLTRALGRMGVSVQTAMSGEEAWVILSDNEVDLVLMDLRMPSMSGQTLYHMIATQWPHLADRVIVMSGDPEAQDHEDWLGLHDLPVLTKPFEIQQLLDLVTRLTASERREANGQ